jgi:hypothetical protein
VNKVFIACCDRAGVERGQEWTEGTAIVGADGWVLSKAQTSKAQTSKAGTSDAGYPIARALVHPAQTWDKTISPANDLFLDRRPEVYARLDGVASTAV